MGQNGMQMLAMVVPIAAVGGLSYYLVQRRRKRSDRAVQDQRNRRA
jgi:preprotein translocase subunit YajC